MEAQGVLSVLRAASIPKGRWACPCRCCGSWRSRLAGTIWRGISARALVPANSMRVSQIPFRRGGAETRRKTRRGREIESFLFPGFERGGSGDTRWQRGIRVMTHDSLEALRLTCGRVPSRIRPEHGEEGRELGTAADRKAPSQVVREGHRHGAGDWQSGFPRRALGGQRRPARTAPY